MLAIELPPEMSIYAKQFLLGWSVCMEAIVGMAEIDKQQVKEIFDKYIMPNAQCQEMKDLDHALIIYLLHKCGAPEGPGKGRA